MPDTFFRWAEARLAARSALGHVQICTWPCRVYTLLATTYKQKFGAINKLRSEIRGTSLLLNCANSSLRHWLSYSFLFVFLFGCTSLPRSGPSGEEILKSASYNAPEAPAANHLNYALVNLRSEIVASVNSWTSVQNTQLSDLPQNSRSSHTNTLLSVGDVVSVTIFEAAAGGLFIPQDSNSRQGNFVQIPNQQIDADGYIAIPYAGNVRIANMNARSAGAMIAKKLASRAIEPQVVISISEKKGNTVSVFGEVAQPARFALDPGGMQLTGAIAKAGGPRYPAFETMITMQRGDGVYRSSLAEVMNNTRSNIAIAPNDVIYLSREQRFVLVFGATGEPSASSSRKVTFENARMTLGEALAKSGGLAGASADPKSLFLLRFEKVDNLHSIGVNPLPQNMQTIPTIYRVNFGTAEGVFMASNLNLREGDVIVASDSTSIDYLKFLNIVNETISAPVSVGTLWASWISAKK